MPRRAKITFYGGMLLAALLASLLALIALLAPMHLPHYVPPLVAVYLSLAAFISVVEGTLTAQGRLAIVLVVAVFASTLVVGGGGTHLLLHPHILPEFEDSPIALSLVAIVCGLGLRALLCGAAAASTRWEEQGLLAVHRRWGVLSGSGSLGGSDTPFEGLRVN